MTKAEPYSDAELETLRARYANTAFWPEPPEQALRFLATITELVETVDDREKAWAELSHTSGKAIRAATQRAEAAEARVSELEKEREW